MMNPFDARERRWWNKLRCGGVRDSAEAAFTLSVLLCNRGREDEAVAILSQFVTHSDDSIAASAAIRLAQIIERGAGSIAAETLYEEAAAKASATKDAAVLIDLADRWMAREEMSRARQAYEAIISESDDSPVRAVAGYRLGLIEREAGLDRAAISRWECALKDAQGTLHVYLVVNLAEALQEGDGLDSDRAEGLFEEAINSDHPDLGPRAAIGLARLKRRRRQLIDAYRLAQLVVDSQHPVFAPEGEAERDRLVEQELDSLLTLPSPSFDQLQLGEGNVRGQHALYLPISSLDIIPAASSQLYHYCEGLECSTGGPAEFQSGPARERLKMDCSEANGRMAGTFLWRAVLGHLDQGDLRTMKQAIQRENVHRVRNRSCQSEPWTRMQWTHHDSRSWVAGDDEEYEFMIILRTAAWLREQTAPGSEGLTPVHFRLVFDQASARLMKLLSRGDKGVQESSLRPESRVSMGEGGKCDSPPQSGRSQPPNLQDAAGDLASILVPA